MLLLRAALEDPRTERSLLVSEACVPLHPFWCLYTFLFSTERSFVKSWRTDDRFQLYDFGKDENAVKKAWRKGAFRRASRHVRRLDAAATVSGR